MRRFGILVSVLALVATAAAPAAGQEGYEPREDPRRADGVVDLGDVPDLDTEVDAFIQLDEEPVAALVAASDGRATQGQQRAQARRVEQQQQRLRAELPGEEIYSLKMGANGIAVRATVRDLVEIGERPEVVSISRLPEHTIENSTSVPWIEAAQAWQDLGFTGEGLSVGIIDTGIDYTHADFGGPGTEAAYDDNDPTTLDDGGFTAKVADGTDFVGDDYNASDPANNVPQPDEDPLDCHGHGTHVAGTAAGQGVLADGSTFTGPYDASTFESNEFEVGPGVAPEATLYALKVFGCEGSTNVTVEAIEWALDPDGDDTTDDALDVINMSLGSVFGQPNDPTAIAASNAMASGMLVVSAAGNSGPVPYVQGSPSSGAQGIAVAASIDDGIVAGAIEVTAPGEIAGLYETAEAAFTPPLEETGPVEGALAPAEPNEACEALTNQSEVQGNIALIRRGTCTFVTKILNAQEAGAIAVVVANNVAGPPIVMGGTAEGITIPAVMVSQDDGNSFLDTIEGGATVEVRMSADFEIPKPELADQLADFTSQGPRGGDLFGPDLAAPGFSIDSAAVGTGFEARLSSGTSMATPHVAGLAALMRQAHPDAPSDTIKSLLMNSTVDTDGFYPTTLMGTGVVRADAALALDVYTTPAGVSFGRLNPTGPETFAQEVTVTDLSGEARTYDISDGPLQEVPGVSVSVPDSVEVAAGGTASFEVTLSLDPSAMTFDDGFYSQTEVDGVLTLSSAEHELRVGYMAVVDPASDIQSEQVKPGQQNELGFVNDGDSRGWIDTFTFTGEGNGTLGALGVREGTDPGSIDLGVASTQAWDSLSRRELDVFIDTNEDGVDDYVLVAADLGLLQGLEPDGRVVTALFDLSTGSGVLEYFVISDLNDHSQILTVDLHGEFGFLEEGDTDFDYFALDLDADVPTGTAEGSVDLKRDVRNVENLSGSLAANSEVSLSLRGSSREKLLTLYQNDQVPDQFEVIQLKPGKGNR